MSLYDYAAKVAETIDEIFKDILADISKDQQRYIRVIDLKVFRSMLGTVSEAALLRITGE